MRDRDIFIDHESADLLLPWYVNGTLGSHEHQLLERHIAGCEQCRHSLALLRDVRGAFEAVKETPIVPPARPEALLRALDARHGERRRSRAGWIAAASFAAALGMLVTFVSTQDRASESPVLFETATSEEAAAPMDYVLIVRFEDGTNPAAHHRVLQGIGARDIGVADEGTEYRVVVKLSAASLEDLERYTEELESHPDIETVSAIALQLPVNGPQ